MDFIVEQFKKGYKTSEFYVTVVTGAVLLTEAVTGLDFDNASIGTFVGTSAAYILGRSWLKGKRAEALSYSE